VADSLKARINDAVKDAMRAGEKPRRDALRLITAEIKRVEVDERQDADDARVVAILEKMLKQRAESEAAYREAGRTEQAEAEAFEAAVIREFMPEALDDAAVDELVEAAVADTGAESMRDMGRVMSVLKPKVQGRADMGAVSARVKARLGG